MITLSSLITECCALGCKGGCLKLRDILDFNLDYYIKRVLKRTGCLELSEDLVQTAYVELLKEDRDFNDANHIRNTFFLRLSGLMRDGAKQKRARSLLESQVVTYVYGGRTDNIQIVELDLDAENILRFLKKKGSRYAPIFKSLLDRDSYCEQKDLATELGITPNTFKVHLSALRKLVQKFVQEGYTNPEYKRKNDPNSRARERYYENKVQWGE